MKELNFEVGPTPKILEGFTDTRWTNKTIYNHFDDPHEFFETVTSYKEHKYSIGKGRHLIEKGLAAFKGMEDYDIEYDKQYQEVARKVRDKLISRGFTTRMLYGNVEFTSLKTGVTSKQRVMMGRKDCYFTNPQMTDGKLFHDLYINLSYSWDVRDDLIMKNAYALYALTKELGKLIAMRVIVVNHVGTNIPTCYSYVLKRFGHPIKPREFLFFISESKRTLGWATYQILNKGSNRDSTVGQPTDTVSIDKFNLNKEINNIWEFFKNSREV